MFVSEYEMCMCAVKSGKSLSLGKASSRSRSRYLAHTRTHAILICSTNELQPDSTADKRNTWQVWDFEDHGESQARTHPGNTDDIDK
jgi:hypothetical protein